MKEKREEIVQRTTVQDLTNLRDEILEHNGDN
jgi:hypothetical protein